MRANKYPNNGDISYENDTAILFGHKEPQNLLNTQWFSHRSTRSRHNETIQRMSVEVGAGGLERKKKWKTYL